MNQMDQAEAIQDDHIPEQAEETEILEEINEENEEVTTEEDPEEKTPEVEFIEVERNGKKYTVPKDLEPELLMQSDYTRKTQEVAEVRKALEREQQEFQQAVQTQQQNMQGHAQLAAIRSQLQQYQNVDWTQFSEADPQAAQQAFFQYSQLKDAAGNLSQQLQQQEAVALQQQREVHAKRLEQGKAELAKDIPGWNADLAQEIIAHGSSYGFSENELKSVIDPRMVKVLNDARMYRQSIKKVTQSKPAEQVKPAQKVRGGASVNVNPDKMPIDQWMKWRNKQLSS